MRLRQLLSTHPRYLGYGFLHYFFSFVGQTFFVGLFVVSMTDERGWTTERFAGIYSGVTLVAAFLLPLIGRQLDRFRVRYVSTITALVMITGCLLLAVTESWWALAVGLLAVRLGGQGVLTLTGSTTIGRFFTRGRGMALSLAIVGISVAEVVIPPVATAIILHYGYRSMWGTAAVLLALVFLPLVWVLIRRHDPFQRADTVAEAQVDADLAASWTRAQVLRDRRFQLIVPIVLFMPFFFTGFLFSQGELARLRGYGPGLMATGISLYGLVRVVMLFLAGRLVDRFGAGKLLPVVLLPAMLGLMAYNLIRASWIIPVFFVLVALSSSTLTVTVPALWAERYGPRYLGSIKSAVGLLTVLSTAAAPLLFTYGLAWSATAWLWVMLAYALVCVGLAMVEQSLNSSGPAR